MPNIFKEDKEAMKIMGRREVETNQLFVNIVLTKEEVEKLIDGKVVSDETPEIAVQIVGYGDEQNKD